MNTVKYIFYWLRDKIVSRVWTYSPPFLMNDGLYRARYYQWCVCTKTGRCKLRLIPGQTSNGIDLTTQEVPKYRGRLPDGVVLTYAHAWADEECPRLRGMN